MEMHRILACLFWVALFTNALSSCAQCRTEHFEKSEEPGSIESDQRSVSSDSRRGYNKIEGDGEWWCYAGEYVDKSQLTEFQLDNAFDQVEVCARGNECSVISTEITRDIRKLGACINIGKASSPGDLLQDIKSWEPLGPEWPDAWIRRGLPRADSSDDPVSEVQIDGLRLGDRIDSVVFVLGQPSSIKTTRQYNGYKLISYEWRDHALEIVSKKDNKSNYELVEKITLYPSSKSQVKVKRHQFGLGTAWDKISRICSEFQDDDDCFVSEEVLILGIEDMLVVDFASGVVRKVELRTFRD